MKATISGFLFSLMTLFVLVVSCQNDSETNNSTNESPRIKKYSKVLLPKTSGKYVIGDNISFELESEKTIDSIIFEYLNEQVKFTQSKFDWSSVNARTGTQRLKLTAYMDGNTEVHYPKLKFLSDITPEKYTYRIINTYPHNPNHYTQGLFFKEDTLFESTGPGPLRESKLAKVDLKTGNIYQSTFLQNQYFGEGSTYWKDKIVMLTWISQTGFVFDFNLQQTRTFNYSHEGWGITTIGDTLYVSDGTETIHLLNPNDFSEFDKLQVYNNEGKVLSLNELETINGLIYANVYQEYYIVVIDPASGKVLRKIDLTGILDGLETGDEDVLNGIAYNPSDKKIYVTGKLWPKIFEVQFTK